MLAPLSAWWVTGQEPGKARHCRALSPKVELFYFKGCRKAFEGFKSMDMNWLVFQQGSFGHWWRVDKFGGGDRE